MSNIEKIKFGDQEFDLVAAGVDLDKSGGTIKFQMGEKTFEEIETILKTNGSIKQIATSGDTDWSRSGLVYAGMLTKQSDYEIDKDTKCDIMIAVFRTPDITEIVAEQAAEIESLKTTVDTLVLSSLEV
ncbi:hypothetical protein [Lacrimispora sp.]|uniref:hypothetical protein n=1 Tax=Lacrimispora sp. TaxID=2719234 RepID=UPI0028976222|nr:hypothetical protein [Lacrimispora sp.]